MHIPIHIVHGKKEGPCLLISGALHGDEMNGIQIIHRLMNIAKLNALSGTLIAIPCINVYGLTTLQRNLPDRRDLERNFPGTESGSFAARLAYTFTEQILSLATHCIDIHTAAPHQSSLPCIHTNLHNPRCAALAHAFETSLVIHDESDRGLLWQEIPTLLYQAGEPLRVDDQSVRSGLRGILRVMGHLGMLKLSKHTHRKPLKIFHTDWLHAPGSGLCHCFKKNGAPVRKGESIAAIYDPFGTEQKFQIISPCRGVVISQNTLPLVNEGDPILQLAPSEEELPIHEE